MALISKRFENRNGRRVDMVGANIGHYGPKTDGGVGNARMRQFSFGLSLSDGRSIEIALTREEWTLLQVGIAEYAERYPWA